MPVRLRSYAKINLGLAVGPVRADGFHGLTTVYQTLALHDFVTVSARRAGRTTIEVTADHAGVPCSARRDAERNTAWKMVAGALERMGILAAVSIGIEKQLPVQGGMGAGSANAAAALLGLERELGLALRGAERLELAAEVGSDVPLFLLGGTVLGLGRGEKVYPLPDLAEKACVIAVPEVGVSTRLAFEELDKRAFPQGLKPPDGSGGNGMAEAMLLRGGNGTADAVPLQSRDPVEERRGSDECGTGAPESITGKTLTFQQGADRLNMLSRALAAIWTQTGVEHDSSGIARRTGDLAEDSLLALVRTGIENDFEEVVFSQHPSLRQTKRELLGSETSGRALCACLSGSGSALFGLYKSQADARAAQQRVQSSGTRAILTETLGRAEYWNTMFHPSEQKSLAGGPGFAE
jgi:4-diphosphocytidyl-2-C-methyl-D-erythritol kinase